jgi:Zn-dependent M28 family amino/carboxypeptidase
MSDYTIADLLSRVDINNLKAQVRNLEGLRHGGENYDALEQRAIFIEQFFNSLKLRVRSQPVVFHGKTFRNIIADKLTSAGDSGTILIGAHYDAAEGSPGADDNASGVAVMLETARLMSDIRLNRTVRFVAFTLEEPQPQSVNFLIGSRHFAEEAKKAGDKYEAVLILESVGYSSSDKGSQIIPSFVRINAPDIGNFLGVVANRASESIMKTFQSVAAENVPELLVATYKVPFSGYLMPETRFSDHSPFWDCGYPALMLTDTAMFRNPHYHTEHDTMDTLDFNFMSDVTKAVISFIAHRACGLQ